MSTICAVEWCAALATVGRHCAIHAKDAALHPQPLAADEEPADARKIDTETATLPAWCVCGHSWDQHVTQSPGQGKGPCVACACPFFRARP